MFSGCRRELLKVLAVLGAGATIARSALRLGVAGSLANPSTAAEFPRADEAPRGEGPRVAPPEGSVVREGNRP